MTNLKDSASLSTRAKILREELAIILAAPNKRSLKQCEAMDLLAKVDGFRSRQAAAATTSTVTPEAMPIDAEVIHVTGIVRQTVCEHDAMQDGYLLVIDLHDGPETIRLQTGTMPDGMTLLPGTTCLAIVRVREESEDEYHVVGRGDPDVAASAAETIRLREVLYDEPPADGPASEPFAHIQDPTEHDSPCVMDRTPLRRDQVRDEDAARLAEACQQVLASLKESCATTMADACRWTPGIRSIRLLSHPNEQSAEVCIDTPSGPIARKMVIAKGRDAAWRDGSTRTVISDMRLYGRRGVAHLGSPALEGFGDHTEQRGWCRTMDRDGRVHENSVTLKVTTGTYKDAEHTDMLLRPVSTPPSIEQVLAYLDEAGRCEQLD